MIEAVPFHEAEHALWDTFCEGAPMATLLHTRKFLAYHGDRMRDTSVLLMEDGKLAGLLPAAESPADRSLVVSHPGATYGGILHHGRLRGGQMIEALAACRAHFGQRGYARFHYKPVPYIYQTVPYQDDLYALFRLDARRFRCDLASSIDLSNRGPVSERRRRGLKKATKSVELCGGADLIEPLWQVLADNLARKHDAKPVHSVDELRDLQERFPQMLQVRCGRIDGRIEAGAIFFNSASVWHAQYIAASERAYAVSALDLVFDAAIDEARRAGARYFDFGTSNEDAGKVLNEGLYQFKSEFGGGGVAYEQYELATTP